MYIYIYICIHIYVYIHTVHQWPQILCIHGQTYMHAYINIYIYIWIQKYIYTHIFVHAVAADYSQLTTNNRLLAANY